MIHAVSDTRGINKVARDDTTKKQIASDFDSNAVDRQKLLGCKPLKDAKAGLQSSIESCLQTEREIIREGSKKLLQIHSEFLARQYPPAPHIKGPVQEPEMTLEDSEYFPKTCSRVQQQHLTEVEGCPSLAADTELVGKNNGESHVGTIGESQQSHESVISGQHALQFAFTKSVAAEASPKEDEHRRRCFAALNNTKTAARELNVNIPIPNISTGFGKKASISGCTASLAIDQGSSTDSVNGGDEFFKDVTSADRTSKYDELDASNGGHFDVLQSSKDKKAVKPAGCITRVKDFVSIPQKVETPATALETTQSGKNQEPETTDRISDYQIETTAEHKQAENKNASVHVSEENHVKILNEGYETGAHQSCPLVLFFNEEVSILSACKSLDDVFQRFIIFVFTLPLVPSLYFTPYCII